MFDERSEEFTRAPRPAAEDSEAGRARAAAAVRRTAPHAAPSERDVTVKLVLSRLPSPGLDPGSESADLDSGLTEPRGDGSTEGGSPGRVGVEADRPCVDGDGLAV